MFFSRSRRRGRRLRQFVGAVGALVAGLAALAPSFGFGPARFIDQSEAPLLSGVPDQAAGSLRPTGLSGRPSHITDGDTLRFGEVRVRLHGVNAPEMDTADGPRARFALLEAIGSGPIRCEDTGERSYRRIVAVCYDAEGRDLAERMVRAGWAKDWPRYSRGRYAFAQAEAFVRGRGVHRR